MGSESASGSPPNLTAENNNQQNPVSEPLKPADGDGVGAQGGATKETSPQSMFVNSEPMREDQVQNAVNFLSHPRVRGSPVTYRRSFLEKKGLTKEEIDEAFRRVPDPNPTASPTQTANPNQDGQTKLATSSPSQVPAQIPQPAVSAPPGAVSTMTTLSKTRFHWSHALIALGLCSASGAGAALLFKNVIIPRLKSWIRKVVLEEEDDKMKKIDLKPSPAEEAASAAKAAAAAAADVAKACQEMLSSKNEEKKHHEAYMNLLGVQLEEMKTMSNSIQKLEGRKDVTISSNRHLEEVQYLSGNVRPSSAPASVEPSDAPPHPKSYMEVMAMIQRGEKPPGIKDINDSPPNPNQPPSNPRLAPRVKPWEVAQAQNGSYYGDGSSSNGIYNSSSSQFNGDSSEPLYQRKNVRISEVQPEDEQRMSSSSFTTNSQPPRRSWVPPQPPPFAMPEAATAIRQPKSSVQNRSVDDKLIAHPSDGIEVLQRITNSSGQNQSAEDKLIARPSDEIEELQRITKLSESGGEVEIDNRMTAPGSYLNEMQDDREDGIEVN